jgi:hypothetical protein
VQATLYLVRERCGGEAGGHGKHDPPIKPHLVYPRRHPFDFRRHLRHEPSGSGHGGGDAGGRDHRVGQWTGAFVGRDIWQGASAPAFRFFLGDSAYRCRPALGGQCFEGCLDSDLGAGLGLHHRGHLRSGAWLETPRQKSGVGLGGAQRCGRARAWCHAHRPISRQRDLGDWLALRDQLRFHRIHLDCLRDGVAKGAGGVISRHFLQKGSGRLGQRALPLAAYHRGLGGGAEGYGRGGRGPRDRIKTRRARGRRRRRRFR